jgi:hypothetical protein
MLGVMPLEVITLCLLTCYAMLGLSYLAFWDVTPCWGYNPIYFGMLHHVGGVLGGAVVKALRYKSAGHGFSSR